MTLSRSEQLRDEFVASKDGRGRKFAICPRRCVFLYLQKLAPISIMKRGEPSLGPILKLHLSCMGALLRRLRPPVTMVRNYAQIFVGFILTFPVITCGLTTNIWLAGESFY